MTLMTGRTHPHDLLVQWCVHFRLLGEFPCSAECVFDKVFCPQDEDGVLCYRPAPNGDAMQYFYLRRSSMDIWAFKAKVT